MEESEPYTEFPVVTAVLLLVTEAQVPTADRAFLVPEGYLML